MSPARQAFAARLRAQRERRGITLEAIAASTKIKTSFLVGLERSDVSSWPTGLYRRAYVRDYAQAIGVPAEPLLAEFEELFPEDGGASKPTQDAAAPLRLTLALEADRDYSRASARAMSAGLECLLVLAAGAIAALLGAGTFWSASGVIALCYYPLATAVTGRTISRGDLASLFSGRLLRSLRARGAREPGLYLVPAKARREAASPDADSEPEFQHQAATS